ncbi:MAG: hypothetical protein GVY09_03480 [Gammaproteobacteria bacterium]|jgi:hypothetical protein|nr:hypothetical protein [Gammaproteobacteria bacterium]
MREKIHAERVMGLLVERFEGQQLARLLNLKSAVDAGEVLGESHRSFLAEVCEQAQQSKQLVDRHPEYQRLYARAVRLYKEIAEQALENEMAALPGTAATSATAVRR